MLNDKLRQTEIPLRFSFSEIVAEPAKDFFRMRDVFTGEEYLLFSKGTSQIIAEGPKLLWLNLISFNGACWQSLGPVGAFQSFDSDDVFFFATEKNPDIEEDQQVQEDLEADPLPYVLLISITDLEELDKKRSAGHHFPRKGQVD